MRNGMRIEIIRKISCLDLVTNKQLDIGSLLMNQWD